MLLSGLVMGAGALSAQTGTPSSKTVPEPHKTAYCELAANPGAYNHQRIRLTAFVTHGFEDFHLIEPNCGASSTQHFGVWVMFGGRAESDTAYCCPGEPGQRPRPKVLEVEGVQIPLIDDPIFRQFTDLLKKEPDTTVRVTVIGRFFSGIKGSVKGPSFWRGFGHMGCCSLFVIEQVESFEPHTRTDLDYTPESGWYEGEGCKYTSLGYRRHVSMPYSDGTAEQAITEQKLADTGQAAWAFSDPQRVALESLKPFYHGKSPTLRIVKGNAARQVFQWRDGKKSIVVVVTRPYWLSFYAASTAVAWVSTTIKESECK